MKMVKLPLHCPKCGASGIWQDEDDAGDYYAGTPTWCFSCRSELPDMIINDPFDDRQSAHSKAYSVEMYERLRTAALGKDVP